MEATRAFVKPTAPSGIHALPSELVLYICDGLPISDICHIATCNRSLWALLQLYLYKRSAKLHMKDKDYATNIIKTGIRLNWNIASLGLAVMACKEVWPSMLDGLDDNGGLPPLFMAVERDRADVVSLLEENGADINIRYKYFPRYCTSADNVHKARCDPFEHDDTNMYDTDMCNTALEIAIGKWNIDLTKRFLVNPQVPVRRCALMKAIQNSWKEGTEAIITSGRLGWKQIHGVINNRLQRMAGSSNPDWIEYLVSADAKAPPYNKHCRGIWTGHFSLDRENACESLLSSMLMYRDTSSARRLLDVFPFHEHYVAKMVTLSAREDCHSDITETILNRTNSNTTTWKEAYAAAITAKYPYPSNSGTKSFLLQHLHTLVRLGAEFNLNEPLESSGKVILEHALVATAQTKAYCLDWVRPLFQFDVDATLLSADGWELYRQYFGAFVLTRERRDRILASHRLGPLNPQGTKDYEVHPRNRRR